MYRTLIFLTLLLACLLPISSSAQTQPSFDSLTVDLWPEFDKPTMLVMYQFTLSPQVRLPAEISLRIPASAGVPHAVANCQPLPIKILCKEDCAGLCPACGTNLNHATCTCTLDAPDPRWDALKKLDMN